ncbi:hypothetical protein [Bacillus thuringiensis]|uniref:hypothetical protein n=1 Tax=Bacillus thuringiensis TaxID=1428 RepID=UPI001EDFE46E|nr:hypothetical protein [Bacillus thuringiensis]MCG3425545.1 hypothetical protein [Bacillus thuringiensis]
MTIHSPYIKTYFNNVSKINNHITFYLFVMDQFKNDSSDIIRKNPNALLSQLYESNTFSSSFNIRAKDFDKEHEKYRQSILINLFINMHSFLEFYLMDIDKFIGRIVSTRPVRNNHNRNNNNRNLSKLQSILNRFGSNYNEVTLIGNELVLTLDYLRLRRNRIVHSADVLPSQQLSRIIDHNGHSLIQYWSNILPNNVVVFPKDNLGELNYNELIAYFNMSRIICQKIDQELMKIIDTNYRDFLLTDSLNQFIEVNSNKFKSGKNTSSENFIKKKIKKFTFDRFGIKIVDNEVDTLVNNYQ